MEAQPQEHEALVGLGRRRLLLAMRPRGSRGQLLAGLLCAVLGFALVVQVHETQKAGLASLRQGDLVQILARVTDESARLEEDTQKLQETRDQLEVGYDGSGAAEQAARDRLAALSILTGTAPAQGPGIRLTIVDPKGRVQGDNLLDTLQELRDAGAEAVQIGTVRVVASTSFVDADGTRVRPPYEFVVIGDPQTLAAALDIPGGVFEILEGLDAKGTVKQENALRIDAVRTLPVRKYARPVPGASP